MSKPVLFKGASLMIREQAAKRSAQFVARFDILPIQEATRRISAETIYGHEPVPGFDNSSMDGFAVRAEETGSGVLFDVKGSILAGDLPIVDASVEPRACYEIMTGAPIPSGFDAIYKVEDVDVTRDVHGKAISVCLPHPIRRGAHFRAKGDDFEVGARLLEQGSVLQPEQIMAMASVGVGMVRVRKKPLVAVLSTGSELVDPFGEAPLVPGKIRNSTASYLRSAIPIFGADVRYYGAVSDGMDVFTGTLRKILADQPDVIITTGAVSKGTHDFIPEVVRSLGAEIHFHHVAIRPGKPQLFGSFREGPVVFGIPGNPISTAVGLRFFVNAYLRELSGLKPEPEMRAALSADVEKPGGLRCFYKARLEASESGLIVTSLAGQPSFIVSSLLQSNAWLVFDEEGEWVKAKSSVGVYPLYPFDYNYFPQTGDGVHRLGVADRCC